jgi:hypothetical protein
MKKHNQCGVISLQITVDAKDHFNRLESAAVAPSGHKGQPSGPLVHVYRLLSALSDIEN